MQIATSGRVSMNVLILGWMSHLTSWQASIKALTVNSCYTVIIPKPVETNSRLQINFSLCPSTFCVDLVCMHVRIYSQVCGKLTELIRAVHPINTDHSRAEGYGGSSAVARPFRWFAVLFASSCCLFVFFFLNNNK